MRDANKKPMTNEDPESNHDPGDVAEPTTTQRQREASGRNASRSTGPRTVEGKAASAANALKHGAYARKSTAIPRGVFAEDPDEVAEYLDAIVSAYQPRNAAEAELVREIAHTYLQLRRLAHLEAEALADAGYVTRTVEEVRQRVDQRYAITTADWYIGALDDHEVDCERIAMFLMENLDVDPDALGPEWVGVSSPETQEDWKAFVDAVFEAGFDGHDEALRWLMGQAIEDEGRIERAERLPEQLAEPAISGRLDAITKQRGRLVSQLARLTDLYARLVETLPDPADPKPDQDAA